MMLPEIKVIGQNIAYYMFKNEIRVREASKRSGLATGTISEITNGKDKRLSYYFILAKSIGMPVKAMLSIEYPADDVEILHQIQKLTPSQKQSLSAFIKTII